MPNTTAPENLPESGLVLLRLWNDMGNACDHEISTMGALSIWYRVACQVELLFLLPAFQLYTSVAVQA